MPYIAAYGTLRKDHYNFQRFQPNLHHLLTSEIEGFELWDFGPYPYVVSKENSTIIVDILETDEITKKRIDNMEFGAGYKSKEVTINGKECTIYYMDKVYPDTQHITSGNYTEYVNKNLR